MIFFKLFSAVAMLQNWCPPPSLQRALPRWRMLRRDWEDCTTVTPLYLSLPIRTLFGLFGQLLRNSAPQQTVRPPLRRGRELRVLQRSLIRAAPAIARIRSVFRHSVFLLKDYEDVFFIESGQGRGGSRGCRPGRPGRRSPGSPLDSCSRC